MDNLGMMDVKNIKFLFSEYNKKTRVNASISSAINIHQFLAPHRHVKVSSSVSKPSRMLLSYPSCPRSSNTILMHLLELAQRKRM